MLILKILKEGSYCRMEMIKKAAKPDTRVLSHFMQIWESAVRATHTFLSEQDIDKLRPLVKRGIEEIDNLYYFDDNGHPQGFVGVEDNKIEMLFVNADARGNGIGKKLASYAIQSLGAICVDVNEQNPQAIGFYEHLGFAIAGRSGYDEQGNPFPILHMRLKKLNSHRQ